MKRIHVCLGNLIFLLAFSAFAKHDERLVELMMNGAREGNIEVYEEYIKLKGDLSIANEKGYTPLIMAAYHGHEELVDKILIAGANPCQKDARGNTALMGAIFKGHLKISYKLMKSKCTIEQKNNEKQTPLMYAALFDRKDIARALIENGASVNDADLEGRSASSLAREQGNFWMLEVLNKSEHN